MLSNLKGHISIYNNTDYTLRVQCRNANDTANIGRSFTIERGTSVDVFEYRNVFTRDPYVVIYAYEDDSAEELIKSCRFGSHSTTIWKGKSWLVNKEVILEQKEGGLPEPKAGARVIEWQQNREEEIVLRRELERMKKDLSDKEGSSKEEIERLGRQIESLKKKVPQDDDNTAGPCYRDNTVSVGGAGAAAYRFLATARAGGTPTESAAERSSPGPTYK